MPKRNMKVVVCNYSNVCDGNCEKCKWLPKLKIVDLADLKVPTLEEKECGCS